MKKTQVENHLATIPNAVFLTNLPPNINPMGLVKWVKYMVNNKFGEEINILHKCIFRDGTGLQLENDQQYEMVHSLGGTLLGEKYITVIQLPGRLNLLARTIGIIFKQMTTENTTDFSDLSNKFIQAGGNPENIDFTSRGFVEYLLFRIGKEIELSNMPINVLNLDKNWISNFQLWTPLLYLIPSITRISLNYNCLLQKPEHSVIEFDFEMKTQISPFLTGTPQITSAGAKPSMKQAVVWHMESERQEVIDDWQRKIDEESQKTREMIEASQKMAMANSNSNGWNSSSNSSYWNSNAVSASGGWGGKSGTRTNDNGWGTDSNQVQTGVVNSFGGNSNGSSNGNGGNWKNGKNKNQDAQPVTDPSILQIASAGTGVVPPVQKVINDIPQDQYPEVSLNFE